jgi:hypothetical protein
MPSLSERADALELQMSRDLDARVPIKSVIYTSGERDPTQVRLDMKAALSDGQHLLMQHDGRLPQMPQKPTLMDFFRLRFGPANHLLQSARLAMLNGHEEKIVLACLLHDISVIGFMAGDHGYWGAELVAPYVDEEVSWAIRAHQALRFFPDPEVGYEYPESYVRFFGEDFTPEPYVHQAYKAARAHKWYMTGRLITLNDLYSFDPNVTVALEDFTDIIGRNFRQPEEGLGFDHSPAAHLWRTINWPTRAL